MDCASAACAACTIEVGQCSLSSLRVGSESGESGWLAMYQVEVKVDRPDGHQEKLA